MAAPGRLFVLLLAAVSAGCLPEPRAVNGWKIHGGRNIERPAFVSAEGRPWVLFEERVAHASKTRSGVVNVAMTSWQAGELRRLVSNKSERLGWNTYIDRAGVHYLMADERTTTAETSGFAVPIATLVRMNPERGIIERIPEVTSFSAADDGQFLYRKPIPGGMYQEQIFRNHDGRDVSLGPSSGPAQIAGPGKVYFVTGDDGTLTLLRPGKDQGEPLRSHVTRFLLRGDEAYAVLSVEDGDHSQTVIFNMITREETRVPGTPCCWLRFDDTFVYAERASESAPGKLHFFKFETGDDRVLMLPVGLSDVSHLVPRPNTDISLIFDSRGRVAEFQPSADPPMRLLSFRPKSTTFSDDGRYLIYVEPEVAIVASGGYEGPLMVQDADFRAPPRQLSPRGLLVSEAGFFFLNDEARQVLVFWGHFGPALSDLYFGNHETLDVRHVAEGISEVSVTTRRLVGIVRTSQQDLVGDLVIKDLDTDKETIIAYRVSDAAIWGNRVAFVIRDRVTSDIDGLWATQIE